MSQQRFWNFKSDDLTRDLIRWMTGLHPSGRYFGYDFNPTGDLNLNLVHSTTGFKYVNVTPAESAFLSLVMTRQGTMILEDGPVTINNISAGDVTNPRIDLIILTHERIESAGGSQALYSVIEGTPAASPSAPAVTDALRQTIIGELLIPANTTLLTDGGVVWTPSKKPTFAGGSPLDDINLGANKALETDASGGVIGSAITSTELSRLAGVTSSIQTQINSKQATVDGAATTVTAINLTINRALISNASGKIAVHSTVSDTELGYLNGVTSNVQTQIDTLSSSKQNVIAGAATTITSSDLTANRALISNASGKVAVHSTVSDTELGYLNGVTSAIQTQLNTIITDQASLKYIILNIGTAYDMSFGTSKEVPLTGGITHDQVQSLSAIIYNDDDTVRYDFAAGAGGDGLTNFLRVSNDDSVWLFAGAVNTNLFTSSVGDFTSSGVQRGKVIVGYL